MKGADLCLVKGDLGSLERATGHVWNTPGSLRPAYRFSYGRVLVNMGSTRKCVAEDFCMVERSV